MTERLRFVLEIIENVELVAAALFAAAVTLEQKVRREGSIRQTMSGGNDFIAVVQINIRVMHKLKHTNKRGSDNIDCQDALITGTRP